MALSSSVSNLIEAFIKSSDQVIFAYDLKAGSFSFLNPAFERVWRKTRRSVLDNPYSLLKTIHPDDMPYLERTMEELREGILVNNIEFRILVRKNIERYIRVRPRLVEENAAIVGIAEDITPQKHYNENIRKYSDKKNSILNILSHDLAGPLGMIQVLSQALRNNLKASENQEALEMLGHIEKSSKQGMQLIQDFTKQEFLESSSVEIILRRTNLVEKIKNSIEEYQTSPINIGKTFRFHSKQDTIILPLDENKFILVINNLISNAIKFTPDGGEITVTLEEKPETVLITVADTGIGIPAKYQDKLFEKFTRARRQGIKGEPSVGLGMSIIKTIVEWHQGKIWFESEENKGTTFYIEIPLYQ
jgi:two-component system sensor histidine kinase VicK